MPVAQVVQEPQSINPEVLSGSTTDKMTNMMPGTFSGTGVNAAPYGYTMAGKPARQGQSFNKDLSGDQWVIGYTPNVVISPVAWFSQRPMKINTDGQ